VANATAVFLFDGSYCCGPMGSWGWLGMAAMMVGLVALVAWAIQGSRPATTREMSALEILAVRYANGEISEEEYDERHSVLDA